METYWILPFILLFIIALLVQKIIFVERENASLIHENAVIRYWKAKLTLFAKQNKEVFKGQDKELDWYLDQQNVTFMKRKITLKEQIIRRLIRWLAHKANYVFTATWVSPDGKMSDDNTYLIQVIALYPQSDDPNFKILDANFE